MSYEAVFWVRRNFMPRNAPFEQKWLTVPTDDRAAAIATFQALGFETRGGTILNQDEATAAAARIGSN